MTDRTRQRIVYSALVLAVIYAVYSFWPSGSEKTAFVAQGSSPHTVFEQPAPDSGGTGLADIDAKERLPWGQNPFHRRDVSPVAATQWNT